MPPALLLDLNKVDLQQVLFNNHDIEKVNPHRYEMRQLDGIIYYDLASGVCLGYKDVTEQEFWVRGHIPGKPLMPGVIMIEAAAQLASFFVLSCFDDYPPDRFVGFGRIDEVKFRSTVTPGQRLHLIVKLLEHRPRRFVCAAQGMVNGQMAFEAKITGMPL